MNKDQVEGRADQVKGSVKEGVGKAIDDKDLQAEGQVDKAGGKAQSVLGDVKEKVKGAIDKV